MAMFIVDGFTYFIPEGIVEYITKNADESPKDFNLKIIRNELPDQYPQDFQTIC